MSTRLKLLFAVGIFNYAFAKAQITFSDQAAERGADIVYGELGLGAGISFFDYDGDGLDDITLAASPTNDFQFLKNVGGAYIVDDLGISSYGNQTRQVIWVDFDNDDDYDFFAASDVGLTRLYRNDGIDGFVDITEDCGFSLTEFKTFGGSWGDYNKDGFLDLYVSIREGDLVNPNILYRNNGDGTFTDVTIQSGLESSGFLSFCSAWFDYNNDGFQDIYVANDRYWTNNLLYKNNGNGTFTNVSTEAGVDFFMDAMSTTIDDYNNDGWFDIYVTNTYPPDDDLLVDGSVLHNNNSDGTFSDVSETTNTDFLQIGWGSIFLDVDNDGDHDLFVNGVSLDTEYSSSLLFERINSSSFEANNNTGFEVADARSFSCAMGDLNSDGYPDIVTMNSGDRSIYLWENNSNASENNWLKVDLEGVESNRMGVGSRIEISVNGEKQYHYTLCGEGYIAQNSKTEFFGLGTATTIDYVKVNWLSGQLDYIENVDVNQTLEIVEGSNPLTVEDFEYKDFELFPNPSDNLVTIRVQEFKSDIVRIFDVLGNLILEKTISKKESTVDISSIERGLYLVNLGNSTKKLIVQ